MESVSRLSLGHRRKASISDVPSLSEKQRQVSAQLIIFAHYFWFLHWDLGQDEP